MQFQLNSILSRTWKIAIARVWQRERVCIGSRGEICSSIKKGKVWKNQPSAKKTTRKINLMSRYLRRRLELLSDQMADIHKRRSVSESSTSTVSSIQSSNSESGEQLARYDLLSRILADVLMRVQAVAENVFAICCWWNLFLTHAVLSRTIDWTFCPTLWNKSLKPELMSWHPDLCTISVPVLAELKLIWRACFFLKPVANYAAYLGARGKKTQRNSKTQSLPSMSGLFEKCCWFAKARKRGFQGVFWRLGLGICGIYQPRPAN